MIVFGIYQGKQPYHTSTINYQSEHSSIKIIITQNIIEALLQFPATLLIEFNEKSSKHAPSRHLY